MPNQTLTRSGFLASDSIVATLAREYATGVQTTEERRGTYLKILTAHTLKALQDATPNAKRVTAQAAQAALESAHEALYAIVLNAITTDDVKPEEGLPAPESRRRARERNRRSNFARTSKSALGRFIKAGGKLSSLKPADVTKERLAAVYAPVRAGPGDPAERVKRVGESLLAGIRKLAEEDAGAAEEAASELRDQLEAVLAAARGTPKPLTRGRMKVGQLTLHPAH